MDEYRRPMSSETPPAVWIVHSDPALREASVTAARQMGLVATPLASAAQALKWLTHGQGLIPDLILFDDAEEDICPARFAATLTEGLGELAPSVIYIVGSKEAAEALTSPPLRPGQDMVFQRPVLAHDVMGAVLSTLRRSAEEGSILHAQGLEFDVIRRTLAYRGRNIHLTRFECGFMEYVMRRRDRVVTNDELLEHVWGFEPSTGTSEVVRAHVRNLRRKLQLLGAPRDVIWTVPGRGYRLREAVSGPPGRGATPEQGDTYYR